MFAIEEHDHGDTTWVAIRSRGAEWSWLTPEEALQIAYGWISKYGTKQKSEELSGLLEESTTEGV